MTGRSLAPRCVADEHCITCGDHAVAMWLTGDGADGLERCRDAGGALELVDTTLVGSLPGGTCVLVHAGVALAVLEDAP
jgi:hypothetical protein